MSKADEIEIWKDRNIKFTFKLYRKERERAVIVDGCKNSASIKYKNRRIIQSNTIAQNLCYFSFRKRKSRFYKISTKVDNYRYIYISNKS